MSDRPANEVKVLARRPIYKGSVVDLSVETIELPNGKQTELELIRHCGAAAVVPIDSDGTVILVRQIRHATGGWLLEVPAGKLDAGEEPQDCAYRETVEEIGYSAGELIPLGSIYTTPGFTDERIWLYLAVDLEPATQALEDDEVLTIERLPFAEALLAARTGQIVDGKTVCALFRAAEPARARGLLPTT